MKAWHRVAENGQRSDQIWPTCSAQRWHAGDLPPIVGRGHIDGEADRPLCKGNVPKRRLHADCAFLNDVEAVRRLCHLRRYMLLSTASTALCHMGGLFPRPCMASVQDTWL